jgi:hypothetical protein
MMTCRDVSTAVAEERLGQQGLATRLQIWMHLLLCLHCRRFWRQLRAIDRGVVSWLRTVEAETPPDLARRAAVRMAADPGGPPQVGAPPSKTPEAR